MRMQTAAAAVAAKRFFLLLHKTAIGKRLERGRVVQQLKGARAVWLTKRIIITGNVRRSKPHYKQLMLCAWVWEWRRGWMFINISIE